MATRGQGRESQRQSPQLRALKKALSGDAGYFRWLAWRANEGDVSSAEEMLHGFCDAVEEDRPIPDEIRRYLQIAFSLFLTGASSMDKALNLVPLAHRLQAQGRSIRSAPSLPYTCS